MAQFLKNPLVIHVASEVVVLASITFYFQRKMLSIEKSMKNMVENVEKIHGVLYEHEKILGQIMNGGNIPTAETEKQSEEIIEPREEPTEDPPRKKKKKKKSKKPVQLEKIVEVRSDEESFDDDDLDNELGDELSELAENNLKGKD